MSRRKLLPRPLSPVSRLSLFANSSSVPELGRQLYVHLVGHLVVAGQQYLGGPGGGGSKGASSMEPHYGADSGRSATKGQTEIDVSQSRTIGPTQSHQLEECMPPII